MASSDRQLVTFRGGCIADFAVVSRLLANRARRAHVARCRDLLGQPPPEAARPESAAALLQRLTGVDPARCPVCGEGRMHRTAVLVPPDSS